MNAEAPVPDLPDEEFLDQVFERAVSLCEDGANPDAEELLDGREHLRAEVESLLRTARLVTPVRSEALPSVRGFALLGEIGRGGMGAVYLAHQEALGGRRVALKVLPSAAGLSARSRERFLVEARVLASLRHPNVVTVHDVVAGEDVLAYAMEWVDGASLGQLLESLDTGREDGSPHDSGAEPSMTEVRELLGGKELAGESYPLFVSRIGIAVARALAALHRAGLVHRDVKPSNVLLRKDGTPLLSDFGLVHDSDGVLTQSGQFVGTLAYASPEQLGGDPESLDARSDVYALGVTLYHALTLHLPFDDRRGRTRRATTPTGMLRRMESRRAVPLRAWNSRLPRDLETILTKATDPDPARRYPMADEFADDLERLLALQPIRARPAGFLSRSAKLVRRNRSAALGIGAGSVASLALAAAAVVYTFIVPRWVAEHVREARLALLDPAQANAVFNANFFGVSSRSAGSMHLSDGALAQAARHYDAALRWTPLDAALRTERDVIVAARRAKADPVTPDAIDPADVRSTGLLAYLRGDIETALEHWERFEGMRDLTAAPDPLVEAALGFLYLVREEDARAYPRLREACRSFPDVAFLTTYLADAALRCGDLDVAERLLLAAESMERPDPVGSRERVLADLRAAQGRDAEAEALYLVTGPASPAGLHHARFLESRGRREASLDLYMTVASTARGARVQGECAAAVERWWTDLPGAERLQQIHAAMDMDPGEPRSLVARLRVVVGVTSDADSGAGEGLMGRPGASSSQPSVLFSAFSSPSTSPSLQNRPLIDLARTLEVHEMNRWNAIPGYPRPLKHLQFWAWRSSWPTQLSNAVSFLASSLAQIRQRMALAAAVVAGAGVLQAQNCPDAPCFQGLGDLPGGAFFSFPDCISSDGTTVGGGSATAQSAGNYSDYEAFVWRADTGMVYVGDLPGNENAGAVYGLSADGSIAVGWSSSSLGDMPAYEYAEGFRWTQAGGMVGIGDVPGGFFMSQPTAISDDGLLVVSFCNGPRDANDATPAFRAATWTSADGWVVRGGGTSNNYSAFSGASRNGQWATGRQESGTSSHMIRWSDSLGWEDLGPPLSGVGGGYVISDDGRAICGQINGREAILWEEGLGHRSLGDLPGGDFWSSAFSLLRDGSLIVGTSVSSGSSNSIAGYEAVIWDESRSMRRLVDVLAEAGVVIPPGWTLQIARDIVKNCYAVTVCGSGMNPSGDTEAWIARFPTSTAPAPIAAAGADQSVPEVQLVTLDGSQSTILCGPPSHSWTQLAGQPVSLDLTDPVRPTFTAPFVPIGGGTLTFQLVVGDGTQESAPDVVNVTITNVNHAPVVDAGDDQAVAEGSVVALDGSDSFDEDDDPLVYSWLQVAGSPVFLDLTDPVRPTFTAPFVGASGDLLAFELTIDDSIDTSADSVAVVVENVNHLPIADAGLDQTRGEGVLVALDATGSGDPDGDALSYSWLQIGGTAVVLSDATSATPSFTAPQVGSLGEVLVFRVTVDDGFGGFDTDDVEVALQDLNSPPACELARASVTELWPPNHKLVAVSILGVTDPENDAIAITILGVTQDEPIDGTGDGDTAPDAVIQGGTVLLRAERQGGGNGRVYRVTFQADDGSGGLCTGTVEVCVPRSRGKNSPPCIDDGQVHDSLGP